MSEPTSEQQQMAALAADRLIGFYPTINASDPQTYAAGLVQIFCAYPEFLVSQAIDPVHGLPSECDYLPTIAKVKGFLEPRWRDHCQTIERRERFKRKALPAPEPESPEVKERVVEGFLKLKKMLG